MVRRRQRRRQRPDPLEVGMNAWIQLAFFVVLLVMLLVFHSRLAQGAAGCFMQLTAYEETTVKPPRGAEKAKGVDAEATPPTVKVTFDPNKKVP